LQKAVAEAVRSTLYESKIPVFSLSVTKMPKSGRPKELLDYEGISRDGIVREVKNSRSSSLIIFMIIVLKRLETYNRNILNIFNSCHRFSNVVGKL